MTLALILLSMLVVLLLCLGYLLLITARAAQMKLRRHGIPLPDSQEIREAMKWDED